MKIQLEVGALPRVLIFSELSDFHTEYIVKRLGAEASPLILNINDYGKIFDFQWDSENGPVCRFLQRAETMSLSSLRSIWWRRPFGLVRERNWPSQNSSINPLLAYILGFISALARDCFAMNNPRNQFDADRKVLQLQVATRVGFVVPSSLLSNSASEVSRFSVGRRVVVKGHSPFDLVQGTRFIEQRDLNLLSKDAAPLIFQEFIAASREHRVVHICGEVFGGSFDLSRNTDCPDVRSLSNIRPLRTDIPKKLADLVRAYCCNLGLSFAAFDFREKDGVFFFLEANAAGEWLYIDECNNWQISRAIKNALTYPKSVYRYS